MVHIRLHDEGGWWIEEIVKGDTANKVLEYMEYDVAELYPALARDCERAIRDGRMTLAESQSLKRFYEGELNGYAYLEPAGADAPPECPLAPARPVGRQPNTATLGMAPAPSSQPGELSSTNRASTTKAAAAMRFTSLSGRRSAAARPDLNRLTAESAAVSRRSTPAKAHAGLSPDRCARPLVTGRQSADSAPWRRRVTWRTPAGDPLLHFALLFTSPWGRE